MKPGYFKLFSYNIPVMGKAGAIIVSLQRQNYTVIPQFLCEILQEFDDMPISKIEKSFKDKTGTIRKYFDLLQKQGLGFYTETPECFPKLSLQWHPSEPIKSSVIEIDSFSKINYEKILKDLDTLSCKYVELWLTGNCSLTEAKNFLLATEDTGLRSISVIIPFKNNLTNVKKMRTGVSKLQNVYVYNAPQKIKSPEDGIFTTTKDLGNKKKTFRNFKHNEFIIYMEFFMESIRHNPYYNQKICIDKAGFIRNCLTHENDFGNVMNVSVSSVAANPAFRELWYACNDKIEEIRDSEFRYIWYNTYNLAKTGNGTFKLQ